MFCIVQGPTVGRRWGDSAVRAQVALLGRKASIRRRMPPHALRHAHACELGREGIPTHEVIDVIGSRPAPMVPALGS